MTAIFVISFILFTQVFIGSADDSINLLFRSTVDPIIRRYCVELATLPNGHTVNVTSFDWHFPYIASPSLNACNITDMAQYLPETFPLRTILVIYEHQCKMTEHAWNVEEKYGQNISLLILTNRTNTHYELIYNTTSMPVSIPVLVFLQKDFNKVYKIYTNMSDVEISINYAPQLPRKFRPSVLIIFALVFFLLMCGNHWAADEFSKKIRNSNNQSLSSNLSVTPVESDSQENSPQEQIIPKLPETDERKQTAKNSDPPVLAMSYGIIVFILCFAVGWLLLIFYFPKVMVYILQVFFCVGAFSSMITCLTRLSYFAPALRRYSIPSHNFKKPCTCKLDSINIFTLFAMTISLTLVIIWYINRQAAWGWILQDILGAAVCITIISIYRIGNMRFITLILLGFFLYDIFFVFITPYISFFQPSQPKYSSTSTTTKSSISTTTIAGITTSLSSMLSPSTQITGGSRVVSRNPSVMEQVALGIGANGEIVPLLFAIPSFIPESEIDPCMETRKSMLGFGDIILPGILLTFCKIFDIATGNHWPIYYIQSIISYFVGLTLTHVALYAMNTAQPALLYLVPCVLISTIVTGLCRGELKELYTGKRIQSLLENKPTERLLRKTDNSVEDQINPSNHVIIGVNDTT